MSQEIKLLPPPKDDTVLWKYMSDEKFYKLLDAGSGIQDWAILPNAFSKETTSLESLGSLWMCLPKGFKDNCEGTFPALNRSNIKYCEHAANALGVPRSDREQRYQSFAAKQPDDLRKRTSSWTHLDGSTTVLAYSGSFKSPKAQQSPNNWPPNIYPPMVAEVREVQ